MVVLKGSYLLNWRHARTRYLPLTSIRNSYSSNNLHTTTSVRVLRRPFGRAQNNGDILDQDHVITRKHLKLNVQSQAAQSGFDARMSEHPYDAASPQRGTKAMCSSGGGNPEQIGFAEQVGSQSATADYFVRKYEAVVGEVQTIESKSKE